MPISLEMKLKSDSIIKLIAGAKVGDLYGLELDQQTCVILVQESVYTYLHGGTILVTYDRGETWQKNGAIEGAVKTVRILPPDSVFILWHWEIEGVYPGLTWTLDRGRTWSQLDLQKVASERGESHFAFGSDLKIKSPKEFSLMLKKMGRIHTNDGGLTWREETKPLIDASRPPSVSWCRVRREDDQLRIEIKDHHVWTTVVKVPRHRP